MSLWLWYTVIHPCQTDRYSRSQWFTMLMICCACACFTARRPRSDDAPENIPPNPPDLYTYFYCLCMLMFLLLMIHSTSSCHFLPGFRWFSTAKHSVVNPFLESEAQLFEALTIGVGKVPNSERTQYNPYIRDYVEGKLGDSNFWEIGSENEDDW